MTDAPTRLLLIEDNPADARLIQLMLAETAPGQFNLEICGTLGEGLTRIERGGLDVVLLDLGLPDSKGIETLARMREKARLLPILVLTGLNDQEAALEAVRRGAQDYLIKGQIEGNLVVRAVRYAIERKRVEEAMRESERKLKEAQRLGRIGRWEFDLATRQIHWSDMVFDLFERDPKLGPPTEEEEAAYYSREDAGRLRDCARKTIERKEPYEVDVRVILPGGRSADFVALGTPVEDAQGRVIRLAGTVQDITARKRAERELSESESRYRLLAENISDVIWTTDLNLRFTYVSPSQAKLSGFTVAETLAAPIARILTPESLQTVMENLREELAREGRGGVDPRRSLTLEVEQLRKDGSTFWSEIKATFLRGPDGQPVGVLGVTRDTNERRKMQAQLVQSDRLASVGVLASGVAHEINNPLTYILYNLQSAIEELPGQLQKMQACLNGVLERCGDILPGEALAELSNVLGGHGFDDLLASLKEAFSGAERVRQVVRDLKTFSRVDDEQPAPVELNRVIEGAVNLAFNEIRFRARVVKDLGSLPILSAHEGRLAQVFLNLLVNAAQAIPEGSLEQNQIRVRTRVEGGEILAEVQDTGCGIRPEHLSRMFEPFFTTKPKGSGTGLGLSISQSIVQAHGGRIEVESAPGKGSRFIVRLPVPKEEAVVERAPAPQAQEPESPAVRGRILVVDDEPGMLSTLKRLLSREHEVVAAGGGNEARQILERDAAFDLILCDLMMPEITGMDLHEWLIQKDPEQAQRMVFMTGGAFTEKARSFISRVQNLQVEKPFDARNLRRLVRELVAGAAIRRTPRR